MKLKQVQKIHYVTANRFMYILGQTILHYRNCGRLLARKAVYNHCELENRMLFAPRTSNAIVLWLRRFALLY